MLETVHTLSLTEAMAGFQSEGGKDMRLSDRQDQGLTAPPKWADLSLSRVSVRPPRLTVRSGGEGSQSEGPVFRGIPESQLAHILLPN